MDFFCKKFAILRQPPGQLLQLSSSKPFAILKRPLRPLLTALALALLIPLGHSQIVVSVTWDGGVGNMSDNNWKRAIEIISLGDGIDFNLKVDGNKLENSVVNVANSTTKRNLTISAGDLLNINSGRSLTLKAWLGDGTIDNSGTLSLSATGTSNTSLEISDGIYTVSGTGEILLSNNGHNRILGSAGSDTLIHSAGHTIRGSGQLGANQLTLVNHGTIQADQSVPLTVDLTNGSAFTNQGTLIATNNAELIFADPLTNASVVFVDAGSSFIAQSTFAQSAGATVIQGGTLTATATTINGGGLFGSGIVNGPVTSAGVISPGNDDGGDDIGDLTFNHSLTLLPASLLFFELGGAENFDTIQAQSASLGGVVTVGFINEFELSVQSTDTFDLLTTTSGLTGTFLGLPDGSRLTTLDGFGSFQVNYFANTLRLSDFQAIPEPSTYALIGIGAVVMVVVLRRRR